MKTAQLIALALLLAFTASGQYGLDLTRSDNPQVWVVDGGKSSPLFTLQEIVQHRIAGVSVPNRMSGQVMLDPASIAARMSVGTYHYLWACGHARSVDEVAYDSSRWGTISPEIQKLLAGKCRDLIDRNLAIAVWPGSQPLAFSFGTKAVWHANFARWIRGKRMPIFQERWETAPTPLVTVDRGPREPSCSGFRNAQVDAENNTFTGWMDCQVVIRSGLVTVPRSAGDKCLQRPDGEGCGAVTYDLDPTAREENVIYTSFLQVWVHANGENIQVVPVDLYFVGNQFSAHTN